MQPIEYYLRRQPSLTMRLYEFLLRYVLRYPETTLRPFVNGSIYCRVNTAAAIPKVDKKTISFSVGLVQGRQVFTLQARQRPLTEKVVMYLHGGGYTNSFSSPHWFMLQELVRETGHTVVAPDYPLAPQQTCLAVLAQVQTVYEGLVALHGAPNVQLAGDSAGGGLALALVQKLKRESIALPAKLLLLSPWLDATLENPELAAVAPLDPMLTFERLRLSAAAYRGDAPLDSYPISPLRGDLTGLPRMAVFTGTHDMLLADARAFKRAMAAVGNPIDYFEYNGAFHVWIASRTPEGKPARRQLYDLLK